jgi:hypothetical protein
VLAVGDDEAARATAALTEAGLTVIPVPFARTGVQVVDA